VRHRMEKGDRDQRGVEPREMERKVIGERRENRAGKA
jgi:hypothetical protein